MQYEYYHTITVEIVFNDGTDYVEQIIMKKCYLTDTCIYLSENKESYNINDQTFLESEIEKLDELYSSCLIFNENRWLSVSPIIKKRIKLILKRIYKKIRDISYITEYHDFITL